MLTQDILCFFKKVPVKVWIAICIFIGFVMVYNLFRYDYRTTHYYKKLYIIRIDKLTGKSIMYRPTMPKRKYDKQNYWEQFEKVENNRSPWDELEEVR